MKKPTPKSDLTVKALSIILAASLGLTACEAPKARKSGLKGDKAINGNADSADTAGKGTSGDKGNSAANTDSKGAGTTPPATSGGTAGSASTTAGTAGSTNAGLPQGSSELDDLPQLSAVRTVSLSKMRDTLIVCTVDGTPITVEAFKREFRDALLSLQAVLTTQPGKVNELLGNARELGVALTDDERKRLLETARHKEALQGKTLAQFLKEKGLTEQQFNEQVLMLGLAFKTGTKLIESQLLSEMINRELLLQAARNAGLLRLAMNHYIELKHSPRWEGMIKGSNETAEQIKDDIINQQLMTMEMEQIAKQANVSDDVLKQEYEKNKEGFKHGDRVRIAHIVIAAPSFDNPPMLSIRTQIKKQKPNITPQELDNEEKVIDMQQHNTAVDLLKRALNKEDFKGLADRYTSDDGARATKSGGELGYIDLSVKVPGANGGKSDQEKLTDAVASLKVGEVAPDLVHTAYGYHIVKLLDRQQAGYLPFAEAKNTLSQLLAQQNRNLALVTWMKDRRKKADIRLSDEFNQAAARERSASAGGKPVTAQ